MPHSNAPRRPEPGADYVRALEGAFEAAVAVAGLVEHGLGVGGRELLLRFAGPALEPALLPALEHVLSEPAREPAGVVHLWDTASTGVPLPEPPWRATDIGPLGEVAMRGLGAVHVPADGRLTIRATGSRNVHWWAAHADVVPWWERGAPLRVVFHWLLTDPRRQLIHAAAVGEGARGVLLPGPSGSGKSTLALACLESGMTYAGDDYVLLDVSDPPVAHSLYASARVDVQTLARFPALTATQTHREGEKTVLALGEAHRERIRLQLQVDAVVIPRRKRTRTSAVSRASAGEGLLALAPSSALQLPDRARGTLRVAAELVRRKPVYRLEVGSDQRGAVAALRSILAEINPR